MRIEGCQECSNSHRSIRPLQAVIIGSFRKHLTQIQSIRQRLESFGVNVLSPVDSVPINEGDEFIIFESDHTSDPKLLQDSVFEKIRASSFVVVANIDGYLGHATLIEIGYALAMGIELFAVEPIENLHVKLYCKLLHELLSKLVQEHSKGLSLVTRTVI